MSRHYLRLEERQYTCAPTVFDVLTPGELVSPHFPLDVRQLGKEAGVKPFCRGCADCSSDWVTYYRFDQYLYQEPDDPRQGWGLFGRLGLSTGRGNAIEQFYNVGLAGRGPLPRRDDDEAGVGYYLADLSARMPRLLRPGTEQGVETYYTLRLGPGVFLTGDLETIVNPGAGMGRHDLTIVYGLRLQVDF